MASLSFPGGAAYAVVVSTVPTWLADEGLSPSEIGLLAAAGLPWSFKWAWAPLLDRWSLPFGGRRRGWIVAAGLLVLAAVAALAFADPHDLPLIIALCALVAFFCATQDIATDGYAVEVMKPEEHGPGNALRTMIWRFGFIAAGGAAIAAADVVPWRIVLLVIAGLFLPIAALAAIAPEPETPAPPPKTLADAVVGPFVSFFTRSGALWIAAFIFFYKFGDNMALAPMSAFFRQELNVSLTEIGFAQKTIGVAATIGGALLGGWMLPKIGLGRALWIFGFAQAITLFLYAGTAWSAGDRVWMYSAITLDQAAAGMGTAGLLTVITRACDPRYAATQFALLTSLMGLGRSTAGVPSGYLVEAIGYGPFFLASAAAAIPGLVVLFFLAPPGQREVVRGLPRAEGAG